MYRRIQESQRETSKLKNVSRYTIETLPRFKDIFSDGSGLGLQISYAEQPKPKGIAEAFIIGSDFIGNSNDNEAFAEFLDDIRIYNKALSAQDISVLYDNGSIQKTNASIKVDKGSTSASVEIKAQSHWEVIEK